MSNERDEFIKKITDKFDTKLNSTTPMKSLPSEIKELLAGLYSEKSLTPRLTATLLNGIFTEGRSIFLMSKPLMEALVEADYKNGNIQIKTFDDTGYKIFVKCLRERDIIEVTDESEQFSKEFPRGKAATWQLCDRYPLKLLKSLMPQELDEEGYPYLDLSAEEMHEQWVNAGHAEHYERWLNQQVANEIRKSPASENIQLVQKTVLDLKTQEQIQEIEDRKNHPMKFY